MADDTARDADFFEGEYAQASTALKTIAKQAPLLIGTGNTAELNGFVDQFVAMAERTASDAAAHGHADVAARLGELAQAARSIRTAPLN